MGRPENPRPRGGIVTNRLSVQDIARRLEIGRMAVYAMLEHGIIPGIRIGRKWLITRQAYEEWERTCGRVENSHIDTSAHVV
jgi:excisionase family DNA binding protein